MQNAARAVSVENERLRELLALHSVSEAEICTYLASSQQGASGSVPVASSLQTTTPTAGYVDAPNHTDADTNSARKAIELEPSNMLNSYQSRTSFPLSTAACSESTKNDRTEHSAGKLEPAALKKTRTLSPRSTWRSHDEAELRYQRDKEFYAQSWQGDHGDGSPSAYSEYSVTDHSMLPVSDCFGLQEPLSVETTKSLETSCDTAAEILIQLHRNADSVDTRAALGCIGSTSCSVKNTTIFKLMEDLSCKVFDT